MEEDSAVQDFLDILEEHRKNCENEGKYVEAEIAKNPDNADAWNLTGFASRKLGDYAASEVAYDKALAIDPKHKGALEYKGELYLTLGNLEGAENMFDRLNKVCFLSCKEKKQLAAAIRTYKKAN